jgi:hypothetical protein
MRRRRRRFGLVLLACLPAAALAAQQPQPCWTPEQTMQTLRVGSAVVSPDGRWAAVEVTRPVMEAERSEWRTTLHLLALEGAGPGRVVRQEESARSPAWSPDGRWLAFVSDRSGRSNLWRLAPTGGGAEKLTDLPASPGEYRWSPDGRSIAFLMRDPQSEAERSAAREKRDARVVGEGHNFARLYLVSAEPSAAGRPRLLTPADVQVGGHGRCRQCRVRLGSGQSAIAFVHSPRRWPMTGQPMSRLSMRGRRCAAGGGGHLERGRGGRGQYWLISVHDSPSPALTGRRAAPETAPSARGQLRSRAAIVGWSSDSREVIITEGEARPV